MSERFLDTVAYIGAGQLGQMGAKAAIEDGLKVYVLQENAADSPAARVGAIPVEGSIKNGRAIMDFVEMVHEEGGVTTIEIEHINAEALNIMREAGYRVEPDPADVLRIQDKYRQKLWLESAGFPVAPYTDDLSDPDFTSSRGFVVKSKRGGYDGRGNLRVASLSDPAIAETFPGADLYAEKVVDFGRELSVIFARDVDGNVETYPVVETEHQNNICHTVIAPARISKRLARSARDLAYGIGSELFHGAGVTAVEMFVANGELLVNELAPRAHNSGHLTIDANKTSQFRQHNLAVTGRPLESTAMKLGVSAAVMINILGEEKAQLDLDATDRSVAALRNIRGVHLHFYGKHEGEDRKIGHATGTGMSPEEAMRNAKGGASVLRSLIRQNRISAS